jgi:HK97 family phage prohead protease
MTAQFGMELRAVEVDERVVVGAAAPYLEVTDLAGDPAGERIMPGAFSRSIAHRGDRIPLLDNHARDLQVGRSRRFDDDDDALVGTFRINDGERGDTLLRDLHDGYYGGLSVGFVPLQTGRGDDGVREIREAKLIEVSLVGIPAYEGAGLIAVRNAQDLDELLAPFMARPDVNLDPIPPVGYQRR